MTNAGGPSGTSAWGGRWRPHERCTASESSRHVPARVRGIFALKGRPDSSRCRSLFRTLRKHAHSRARRSTRWRERSGRSAHHCLSTRTGDRLEPSVVMKTRLAFVAPRTTSCANRPGLWTLAVFECNRHGESHVRPQKNCGIIRKSRSGSSRRWRC